MEPFYSICHATNDNLSIYDRYMRSFNISAVQDENKDHFTTKTIDAPGSNNYRNSSHTSSTCDGNNYFSVPEYKVSDLSHNLETSAHMDKTEANIGKTDMNEIAMSLVGNTLSKFKPPMFMSSVMENSNNAVDSAPLFCNRTDSNLFKLPASELSFSGTIKHVQALSNNLIIHNQIITGAININSNVGDDSNHKSNSFDKIGLSSDVSTMGLNLIENGSESTGDSLYNEINKNENNQQANSTKWSFDQSHSTVDASFDSGVRSPDIFSDEEDPSPEPFWSFYKQYESLDKRKIRKMEKILQGVLPPPSVTTLKIDVAEMLKRYHRYNSQPSIEVQINPEEENSTPTKGVSLIDTPVCGDNLQDLQEACETSLISSSKIIESSKTLNTYSEMNTSIEKSVVKMCTEAEAKETAWPHVLKCKYYDVYYNVTNYSERLELLSLRYGERYVGAETESSVCIHSGGLQSPSSASKRKALRLKMSQAKSPGRRLSHLARRRHAFCSAATINEKAQSSSSRMVLIDKNFFPHKKLVNTSEWKSPRRRTPRDKTPGKKTPGRKTPGKKTPTRTPKTKSGGSSNKKAMRRLLLDADSLTRSVPSRESLKRALFVSPEHRKTVPPASTLSLPVQAIKSKRALFGSSATLVSMHNLVDSGASQHVALKRKRDDTCDAACASRLDAACDLPQDAACDPRHDAACGPRPKLAKSLSFGGDVVTARSLPLGRRASELLPANTVDMNEHHKKKLLWAVSEALRLHGVRMSSPGFRETASLLARLMRRLLALPPHAARLASATLSTSDTMLKLAKQYTFSIIQGRTPDECFEEEKTKLASAATRVSGYVSQAEYERRWGAGGRRDVTRSLDSLDSLPLHKASSMPTYEEAAKIRARRQISFDNVDFPKR